MFVYDFLTLEHPFPAVAGDLVNDRGAGALTRAVVATAAAGPDAPPDGMRFEVGAARAVADSVVVPIRWTPASGHGPFCHLEGSLHLEPFEPGTSYLSLSASYDEPPTGLGRREDTRRRQREVELSVRTFLHELAAVLDNRFECRNGHGGDRSGES